MTANLEKSKEKKKFVPAHHCGETKKEFSERKCVNVCV